MGHPPPSPASSIDGLVQLEHYINATAAASQQLVPGAAGDAPQDYASPYHPRYQAAYHGDGITTYPMSSCYLHHDGHIPFTGYLGPDESAGGLSSMTSGWASHYGSAHLPYTPETSPPVRPTTEDISTTQSGRGVVKRPGPAEPRRAKRLRTGKKPEQSSTATDPDSVGKPLSEMAKDMPDVMVYDVGTYAHRPVSIRQQEAVEQGKVKRPLNDFVLYRKAYIDVVKARFMPGEKTVNQQRVSRICGDSWKMEVPEVKVKFKELANIERDKHGQAFPEYKYAPKQGKKPKGGDDPGASVQSKPRTRASTRRTCRRPSTSLSSAYTHRRGQFIYGSLDEAVEVGALAQQQQQGPYESDTHWRSPVMQPLVPAYEAERPQPPPHPQAQVKHYEYHDTYLNLGPGYNVGQAIKKEMPSPASNYVAHPPPAMDPCLDLFIDPSLLPKAEEAMQLSMSHDNPSSFRQVLGGGGNLMVAMPDLDVDGAHNAYLRGGQDDWHIEHFDETGHFNDWMAQEEHTDTGK